MSINNCLFPPILKMFPPIMIIATRGNAIIAVILQWNIYYNKNISGIIQHICTTSKNYEYLFIN